MRCERADHRRLLALGDLERGEGEHGEAERLEVDVRAEAGEEADGLQPVEPGLHRAPGHAELPGQLEHARAGDRGRGRRGGGGPDRPCVEHSSRYMCPECWTDCPTDQSARLTRPAGDRVDGAMTTIDARDRRRRHARRPPPRLGLRRVLGRQRPHHRRLPDERLRLHAARPTPDPRPGCARRPATCSSRATSASWSAARSTATRPSPSTSAGTATACTTWPGWSTTHAAVYDAAIGRGARSVRGSVDRDRRARHARAGPDRHVRRDRAHVREPGPLPRRRARARLQHRQPPPDAARARRSA